MLIFCGFDIELYVEQILVRDSGPRLCCARDCTAQQWLIVKVAEDPDRLAWLCVPLSGRAMQAILEGRATSRDAAQHSATGTVELVLVCHGRAVPDSCFLCANIPEQFLPAHDASVPSAA
jgi:hypothetical protein